MSQSDDPSEAAFRTSSFSGGGNCVEVKQAPGSGPVVVRSSKMPSQPPLEFTPEEWTAFVLGVKAGEFDPV